RGWGGEGGRCAGATSGGGGDRGDVLRPSGLHARDDDGFPRRVAEDSGSCFGGRRGTIYVAGRRAERGGDHDREDQVRAAVPRFAGLFSLTLILSAAAPALGATLYVTNTKSQSPSTIHTHTPHL